ncbi:hypothetical protein [Rothia aerolata]|uniref:Uncharacterized protein n=1 Tax=Rothia aerolata TaxID=1812262 RepID=A0A917IZ63_9MICC|nr:hypothetical protein [Rothia aerolata]GGH66124.1 hypothetical protein GCM10007359_20050 [Rothia aerolata]
MSKKRSISVKKGSQCKISKGGYIWGVIILLVSGGVSLQLFVPSFSIVSATLLAVNLNIGESEKTSEVAPGNHATSAEAMNSDVEPQQKFHTVGCYNNDSVVPCDSAHQSEIINSLDPCDGAGLISYLGGNPLYDSLSPAVRIEPAGGSCRVSVGQKIDYPLENHWGEYSSTPDPLRACFAGQQENPAIISCAEEHVGEVVYHRSPGSAEAMNCETRAEEYLTSSKHEWSGKLDIVEYPEENPEYCIAKMRSADNLTVSLRQLGNNKIS